MSMIVPKTKIFKIMNWVMNINRLYYHEIFFDIEYSSKDFSIFWLHCGKVFDRRIECSDINLSFPLAAPWGHSTTTVTKFYPILTPSPPPQVDNCGHFKWCLPFVMWTNMDFSLTPHPTFLVHVVIEWPLQKWIVVMSAIMHKLLSVNINKFWSDHYQFQIWQLQFSYGCALFFFEYFC